MSKQWAAILIGGLLPAVFLGISGAVQKTASRTGIAPGLYLLIIGLVVALVGAAVALVQRDASVSASGTSRRWVSPSCGPSASSASCSASAGSRAR